MRRSILAIISMLATPAWSEDLSADTVERWLTAYGTAWEARDPEAAASLFSEDAQYFETPWSEPFDGRSGIAEYWQGVTADQTNVSFEYEIIAVNGNTAVAHWRASFDVASSGAELALDGVFVLEFGSGEIVRELREWWVLRP